VITWSLGRCDVCGKSHITRQDSEKGYANGGIQVLAKCECIRPELRVTIYEEDGVAIIWNEVGYAGV